VDARAIALAVPAFFLLIGAELFFTRKKNEAHYRFHDSISSLSCGIGQQVLGVFLFAVRVGIYAWVYEGFRLATLSPRSPAAWIAVFLAVDLAYYAYHWASHRINFFWATHAVHHQSEEYNLSTALRQSWFTSLSSWIFYLPLAIVGFPPVMLVAAQTMNTLYQFWIHTRLVGKLGPLESLLNTPSHHRVHHGTDPRYIDKNYAGVFIVWDHLFGTFAREEGEPVYGTVKPLSSFNPLWANIEPWAHLWDMARRTRRVRDKLLIWFMPPEWRPADLGGPVTVPDVSRAARRRYDVPTPRGLDVYVAINFVLTTAATTALLWFQTALSHPELAASAILIVLTLVSWGALFEARPWAVLLEWTRLLLVTALTAWLTRGTAWTTLALSGAALASLGLGLWVARYRRRSAPTAVALPRSLGESA